MTASVAWLDSRGARITEARVETVLAGHVAKFSVMNTGTRPLVDLVIGPGGNSQLACRYSRRKRGPFRSRLVVGDLRPGGKFAFWQRTSGIEGAQAFTTLYER